MHLLRGTIRICGQQFAPFAMKTHSPLPLRRNRPPDPDETQLYVLPQDPAQDPEVFPESEVETEPEVPAGMEELSTWDEPPATRGVRVKSLTPEDEYQTEELVSEGIDEAERELRLAASTENEDEPGDAESDYPREGILS